MQKIILFILALVLPGQQLFASHEPWVKTEYPQDEDKLWWDVDWWENGKLTQPSNHDVDMTEISYQSGDTEIPAYLFRPVEPGNYPPVLFQHGRRGLDELTLLAPRRLAARGFVVLAPDVYYQRRMRPVSRCTKPGFG